MKNGRRTLLGLLVATLAAYTPAHAEEPLWGEIASTLGKGFLNVQMNSDLQESKPYFHHGGLVALTIDRWDVATTVEYGLMRDLDLQVRMPYFNETLKESFAGQSIRQPLSGMGEMLVGARWRFSQAITDRHKDELALLADLKLPTGDSALRDQSGELITPHLQPNSGNLGAVIGLAANRLTPRGGYWLSSMVSAEAASSRYRRGAMLELHASVGRRVHPFTRSGRIDWMGITGLHFYWMARDGEGGHVLQDSGGSVLSVELGAVGSQGNHGAHLGILLPLQTDIGLAHAPPRLEIQASASANF